MENTEQTLGQYRVGVSFNPGGHETVNEIKRKAAEFIDYLEDFKKTKVISAEEGRLISLAQTNIEDAAMWGVKAVTKPAR